MSLSSECEVRMKKIYVCSPLSGNDESNIENAKLYCEYVVKECGAIPIAPHIYFTQFLNDNLPDERTFGIMAGLQLLLDCDELWYFGDYVSKGMVTEIIAAKEHNIPVRHVPNEEIRNSNYETKEGIEYVQE